MPESERVQNYSPRAAAAAAAAAVAAEGKTKMKWGPMHISDEGTELCLLFKAAPGDLANCGSQTASFEV